MIISINVYIYAYLSLYIKQTYFIYMHTYTHVCTHDRLLLLAVELGIGPLLRRYTIIKIHVNNLIQYTITIHIHIVMI